MVNTQGSALLPLSREESLIAVASRAGTQRQFLELLLQTALPQIFSDEVRLWNSNTGNLGGTFYRFFTSFGVVVQYDVHFLSPQGEKVAPKLKETIARGEERMHVGDDCGSHPDDPDWKPLNSRVAEIADVCIRATLYPLGRTERDTDGTTRSFSFGTSVENLPGYHDEQGWGLQHVVESLVRGLPIQSCVQLRCAQNPVIARAYGRGTVGLTMANPTHLNVHRGAESFSRFNVFLKDHSPQILNATLLTVHAVRLEGPEAAFKRVEGASEKFRESTEPLTACAEQLYSQADALLSRLDPPKDGLEHLL